MNELSDQILIGEIRKGNKQVFKSLYNSYFELLIQFAYRIVFDKDVCKDLVQEVFITLWEKREEVTIKSLKWYLYTAVKNKCLNHLRSLGVKDKHQVLMIDAFLANHADEDVLDPELVKEINRALDSLPPQMKKMFRLKYLNGLTLLEIAEDLDVSVSTVKTQLGRAKQKLRSTLFQRTLLIFFL